MNSRFIAACNEECLFLRAILYCHGCLTLFCRSRFTLCCKFLSEFVCPLGCGRHPVTQSYRTVQVSIVRISELEIGVVTHPPPPGLPLWAAWSRLLLVPPPSIVPRVLLGCHTSVWRVGGSLLSLLRVHCGTKGLALCGVLLPSTPLWNVFA